MTLQSTAAFMLVKRTNGTVLHRWQNRWHDQAVDGHSFMPFTIDQINSAISVASDTVSISFPETASVLAFVEDAVAAAHIVQLTIQKYSSPSATTGGTVVASTTGEVVEAKMDTRSIQLTIGSSLDPVGAQVPPRKFTTTILGAPARR